MKKNVKGVHLKRKEHALKQKKDLMIIYLVRNILIVQDGVQEHMIEHVVLKLMTKVNLYLMKIQENQLKHVKPKELILRALDIVLQNVRGQ